MADEIANVAELRMNSKGAFITSSTVLKVLSLVLALMFSVVLTACGNAGSQKQSESSVAENIKDAASDSHAEDSKTEL